MDAERGAAEPDDDGLFAWRLVRPAYGDAAAAFSGEGARRFGGRWNAPGRPVVYASLHLSLAALETLAHADRRRLERDPVARRARTRSTAGSRTPPSTFQPTASGRCPCRWSRPTPTSQAV